MLSVGQVSYQCSISEGNPHYAIIEHNGKCGAVHLDDSYVAVSRSSSLLLFILLFGNPKSVLQQKVRALLHHHGGRPGLVCDIS